MKDGKHVILCIDDDPDVLSFLQLVLEAEGYVFAGADSAEQGLRVYKEIHPDLIIVDLMMEEVDAGTGFVKDMRVLGNKAPIYMLSSVGDNLSISTDYEALGLEGVLQKPVAKEKLLKILKTKLG
ncbi:MAG: response regulator [Candidatus Eisenbacteria bacterium]|nr:response regulator [Candidatus Eisenbacteria bacterium]